MRIKSNSNQELHSEISFLKYIQINKESTVDHGHTTPHYLRNITASH